MRRKKRAFKGELVSPETLAAEVGVLSNQPLEELAEQLFIRYGRYVITNRAIPDMRDGLKPVQRRILWALRGLHLHNNSPHKKSARVVGEVIGKYHAHGDAPAYEALVNMSQVNMSSPLVDGQGNWGSFTDPPAAQRYTEVRLSKFSDQFLLDPDYLAVTELWPSFDGEEQEPLVLPAKVPVILLNGAIGIAAGASTAIPSFQFKGVAQLASLALRQQEITPRLCLKYLKFSYVNGAICSSDNRDLIEFFKNGYGSVLFTCDYHIDEKEKQIVLTSLTPWFNLLRTSNKLLELDQVDSVVNISSGESIAIAIRFKRNVAVSALKQLAEDISDMLTQSMSYRLNLTVRSATKITDKNSGRIMIGEEEANFSSVNFTQLFAEWAKWRTELERQVLEYRKQKLEAKIAYNNLLRLAIGKLQIIFELLKRKGIDIDAELSKKLKISLDEAKTILSLPVRRLSALSDDALSKEIVTYKKQVGELRIQLKAPNLKAAADLDAIVASKQFN